MVRIICWNEVKDFDAWKTYFDAQADAHRAAGLTLENLWRDIDDPSEVIFVFQAADLEKARSFINSLDGAESATKAGVTDGSIWFVR